MKQDTDEMKNEDETRTKTIYTWNFCIAFAWDILGRTLEW